LISFLISFPSVVLVALLAVVLWIRWNLVPSDRKRTEIFLALVALAEPAEILAQLVANGISSLCPLKYDLYIYHFDKIFGSPSFAVGQLVFRHEWLLILVSIVYGLLPIAVLITLGSYLWLVGVEEMVRALKAFVLNLFAALPVYLCIPVCGPQFAFRDFPRAPQMVAPHPMDLSAAPNGIPSVHFSTSLLVLWFLSRWKCGRIVGFAFAALMVIATLGSGQHYCLDLLCAIPYVAGVLWVTGLKESKAVAVKSFSAGTSLGEPSGC